MRSFMICTAHQHDYSDPVKEDELGTVCAMYREKRNACRNLVGETKGKRPL
jgi:hypothetical protein